MLLGIVGLGRALDSLGVGRRFWYPTYVAMAGPRALADVLTEIRPRRGPVLEERFRAAGAPYPPSSLVLLAYKEERILEVWAPKGPAHVRVHAYDVLAASGGPGPKLREGDLQVPEGAYRLTVLNPNSSYHLSIRVDYPNSFDREKARQDHRKHLGGDIYIHGRAVSIGCLALGDRGIEELFLLVAETGLARSRILIAPRRNVGPAPNDPPWASELYDVLRAEIGRVQGGQR